MSVKCPACSFVNHAGRYKSPPHVLVCVRKYYVIAIVEIMYVCAVSLSDVELFWIDKVF